MKKLLASFFVLASCLVCGNQLDQNSMNTATADSMDVKQDYFYLGFNLALPYSYPQLGYRYQYNHVGVDVNVGATGVVEDYYAAAVGLSLLVFPKPDLMSQFYLGLELAAGAAGVNTSKWRNSFILYPTVFIGKDYTFAKGQKIFGEITFVPGAYSSNSSFGSDNWKWFCTPGFRFGYGF